MNKKLTHKNFKKEALKNPEVRKEYNSHKGSSLLSYLYKMLRNPEFAGELITDVMINCKDKKYLALAITDIMKANNIKIADLTKQMMTRRKI